MTSKARFNPKSVSPTRDRPGLASSKSGAPGASKRINSNTVGASGFVATTKSSSNIQVIFNGKIATPQSLIPRKSTASSGTSSKYKGKDVAYRNVPTIDESTSTELQEKGSQHNLKEKTSINRAQTKIGSQLAMPVRQNSFSQLKKEEEMSLVNLNETETTIVFSLISLVAASDTRDVTLLDDRNARYEAVVQAHKLADNFSSHPTQTLNNFMKNQNETTAPTSLQDAGSQSTSFEISDAISIFNKSNHDDGLGMSSQGTDTADLEDSAGLTVAVRKFISDTTGVAMVTHGCMLDVNDMTKPRNPGETGREQKGKGEKSKFLSNKSAAGTSSRAGGAGGGGDSGPAVSGAVSGGGAGGADGEDRGASESGMHGGPSASRDDASSDGRSGVINNNANNSNLNDNSDNGGGGGRPQLTEVSEQDSLHILREKEAAAILVSSMLLKRLQMMERAVQQNSSHRQHLDYRDLPDVPPLTLLKTSARDAAQETGDQLFGGFGSGLGGMGGGINNNSSNSQSSNNHNHGKKMGNNKSLSSQSEADGGSHDGDDLSSTGAANGDKRIKRLFCYSNAELIQGRSVNAMAWNAVNSDLLAVGYGKLNDYVDTFKPGEPVDEPLHGGLILFWSLRNADYPEKILRTAHPVTSLDFSKLSPMMLAVGFMNGDVAVYDTKREADWGKPVETSANQSGGHSDPVWQVKWIIKGVERIENIVSISTDGNVFEWNLKKGMVMSTLMQLKRIGVVEGWISRQAAGMCFDFMPNDPSTYVVGTEEGSLHRCSVSYNEQYLDNYEGHQGPLSKIRFSSRWPSLFLTCSADWMINLYHLQSKAPLLSMRSSSEDFTVTDICWCPGNSTIFAAVNANAKLQIWDLSSSSIDPVVMIDTNLDDKDSRPVTAPAVLDTADGDFDGVTPSIPPTPAVLTRYDRLDAKEEVKDPPMVKLLKNLTTGKAKRELTCVQFGEKSPTIAVGDNNGSVLVYRIYDPVTITHEGPMQQTSKLKAAILRQVDPAISNHLISIEEETQTN